MRNDELYHFGVKGMKWGHRKSRASSGERKKMTSDQKKALAKKVALAGLGIAATAGAAYAIKNNYSDKVLKPGASIHKVQIGTPGAYSGMYASYNKKDARKYFGRHANNISTFAGTNGVYNNEYTLKNGARIASPHKAKKIFNDLYKSDSNFRKQADEAINNADGLKSSTQKIVIGLSKKTGIGKYDAFNMAMYKPSDAKNKYFETLKKQGISGIHDLNDRRYSEYGNKSGIIYFGDAETKSSKKLSDSTIKRNVVKDYGHAIAKAVGTGVIANKATTAVVNRQLKKREAQRQRDAIDVYRKQHPSSTLTDKQIISREKKKMDALMQSAMSDELYHFGVKGMKWGHRKSRAERKAEKKQFKQDYKKYRKMEQKSRRRRAVKKLLATTAIAAGTYAYAKNPEVRGKVNSVTKNVFDNTSSTIKKVKSIGHSGIKGMKWGRRRFQNQDGSYTPTGRSRHAAAAATGAAIKYHNKKEAAYSAHVKAHNQRVLQDALKVRFREVKG